MIIMPNQLPQPSVDNPLPWKAILHTDDYGGAVVAKSGHVVAELNDSEDVKFIAASASAFYNLVERYEYMRGLVRRLVDKLETHAGIFVDSGVWSEVGCHETYALIREARDVIGKDEK